MCLSKYIYISFKKQNEKSFRLRRCSLGSLRERGVLYTPFTALQCRSHSFLRKLINNFVEGIMQLKRRAAKDSNLFMTWIFGTCILVYTWKQGYIGEWRVPASLFALYLSCMIPWFGAFPVCLAEAERFFFHLDAVCFLLGFGEGAFSGFWWSCGDWQGVVRAYWCSSQN